MEFFVFVSIDRNDVYYIQYLNKIKFLERLPNKNGFSKKDYSKRISAKDF
jgi:hypothetical protein